jgi:AAA family ATP:ADP antiporter
VTKQRDLETTVAVWGAVTFGALLASYSVFRPVRDALVLDGNPDKIPWLFTATFIAMLIVSPLWSAAIARRGRRRLVPHSFHVFALCALGFAGLVATDLETVWVGRVFYVWSSVFNMFVVSVFWSLLADLIGPEAARRLFGPIAAGGTIGAIAGPALTRALVGAIGVPGVLVISALLLELAVLGVRQVRRAGEAIEHEPVADQPSGGAFDGLAQVARSPYLRMIAGYVLCTATAATFLYLEQAQLARAELPDRTARAELFAWIDLWTNLITLVLQTFLAAPLLRRLGPAFVLALLPLAQVVGVSMVVLAPSLGVLVFAQVASRSLTHGMTRPARELLFTILDRDAKYRAKNAIDTIGYRFGDVASAWLHNGLSALGAGGIPLVAATVPIVGIWLVLATLLGASFRRRVTKETP